MWQAGNAYPFGHLVPSPIVGLACAPILETRFLDLAISLLDFSPRILLGTFSILPLGYCFTPYQRLWLYNGAPFSRLLRHAGDTEDVFSA